MKKITAILLAISMMLSFLPTAFAQEEEVISEETAELQTEETPADETETSVTYPITGSCGENLTWTLDEAGTMTISGMGKMQDHNVGTDTMPAPWKEYVGQIKHLVIESGVESIGAKAFQNCSELTDVVIPESVTFLGEEAFR